MLPRKVQPNKWNMEILKVSDGKLFEKDKCQIVPKTGVAFKCLVCGVRKKGKRKARRKRRESTRACVFVKKTFTTLCLEVRL